MDAQKEAAKILYDRCSEFLNKNKELYEETVRVIKYNNLLENSIIRLKKINVDIHNFTQLLDNKYVKETVRETLEKLSLEKMEIIEDIDFYNKKIKSLRSSEDVYMHYIYCQTDIRRYEKILLS
jgi:hypothetical protein